ncbi:uncharacterized protein AFUA_4G13980 [Aspergillus fumigatus Af293]|uniref:Uncharacterized protein n=1 Tax=Aspergillus fumigatus (strain ATCC MYA-4609 / CBS 101355 / FGSC A1100 / Af293) TaxID=330879 RepID=Q4WQT8_ASPFU|nr:hypothetical protein AFUA_4G13980 [Aspergillus fumigatus Af293]EAL89396.1 hypothetical protein AFUA_4G13980 [Aspergillus fumigatus Af293]
MSEKQNEQHDQPPEVQPQQGTQPIPPVQEREGKSVEDYVDEERKLLQGGDTYSGLIAFIVKNMLVAILSCISVILWTQTPKYKAVEKSLIQVTHILLSI